MKHKMLSAIAISLALLVVPHYASGIDTHVVYYGYGDPIYLKANDATELLGMTLSRGEGNLFCTIEASGYVKIETSSAVFKVWLEALGGSNGSEFATDEEISRRYIASKSGALQASFHTSLTKIFPCCQGYDIQLLGTNFSGMGSLYVNYHSITATCHDQWNPEGSVVVLHPDSPSTPSGIVISGYVKDTSGNPYVGAKVMGFQGGFATTNSSGYYAHSVPRGWSGVLSVCSPTYGPCFDSPKTYNDVKSSLTNQNFTQVLSLVPCPACPY
jgi:hypothetical protein